MADRLVVDASPLILLGRIGRLDLLPALAREIVIPSAVMAELQAGHERDDVALKVRSAPWTKFAEEQLVPQLIAAWDLGAGETQVLAYALAHKDSEVVLDDAAARRCAASVGVPAVGTVGLVLRAKARGVLEQARPLIEQLRGAGLYLASDAADRALALVGE